MLWWRHHRCMLRYLVCTFSQAHPCNSSDKVLYYVTTTTTYILRPFPDTTIFKKEQWGFTTAAGHNQVMQPLIALWWKDCGSLHCESQLIISHVPQVINSGESGENSNSELIKDSVLQRFWHFRRFLSIWSREGTCWVSLIPSRRTDNLYKGGEVRGKLMWNQVWLATHGTPPIKTMHWTVVYILACEL